MDNQIIRSVTARKVFNSRGTYTIEVEVVAKDGFGRSRAPGGASTGIHEAVSYPNNSVDQAVDLVNDFISKKLIGRTVHDLGQIDSLLHELDSTKNFSKVGGNTAFAVSLSVAKASADSKGIPLFELLSGIRSPPLPYPLGNVLGGGKHAGKKAPDIQEFLVLPINGDSFNHAAQANIHVHSKVRELLEGDVTFTGGKGDEGAWAPNLDNESALEIVTKACEEVSRERDLTIKAGLDVAASSLWDAKNKSYNYPRDGEKRDVGEQIDYILNLIKTYNLVYVEDPLHEEDFEGFSELTSKADSCLICGDDLFTTYTDRLSLGIKSSAGNAIIIKPNQIGTLTDTLNAVKMAKKARYMPIASHRSGETCDTYLAHLAIGYNCPVVKIGVVGGERVAKVNELLRIEELLGSGSKMCELPI
jgi:enolase